MSGGRLYSRRLTAPSGLRVDGAAGPLALGLKGSIRDRLAPAGWVHVFRPRKLYNTTALARYGAIL